MGKEDSLELPLQSIDQSSNVDWIEGCQGVHCSPTGSILLSSESRSDYGNTEGDKDDRNGSIQLVCRRSLPTLLHTVRSTF